MMSSTLSYESEDYSWIKLFAEDRMFMEKDFHTMWLRDLVERMDQHAKLEHDWKFEVVAEYPDKSVEVRFKPMYEDDEQEPLSVVLAYAGTHLGQFLVEIREEPKILASAIPRVLVAILLNL